MSRNAKQELGPQGQRGRSLWENRLPGPQWRRLHPKLLKRGPDQDDTEPEGDRAFSPLPFQFPKRFSKSWARGAGRVPCFPILPCILPTLLLVSVLGRGETKPILDLRWGEKT